MAFKAKTKPVEEPTQLTTPDVAPSPVTPTSSETPLAAPSAATADINPQMIAAVVAATLQAMGLTPEALQRGQLAAVAQTKQEEPLLKKTLVIQMRALTHARDRTGVIWRYDAKGRYRVSPEIAEHWISNRLAVLDGMPLHLDDPFQGYAGIISARQADAPEAGTQLDATPIFAERDREQPQSANTNQGFLVRQSQAPEINAAAGGAVSFADDLRRQAEEVARLRAH